MPLLSIATNVLKSKITTNVAQTITSGLSKIIGKPEALFSIHISPDQAMLVGGSEEPCAIGTLISIGSLDDKRNLLAGKVIIDALSSQLEIPRNRITINFRDVKKENIVKDDFLKEHGM